METEASSSSIKEPNNKLFNLLNKFGVSDPRTLRWLRGETTFEHIDYLDLAKPSDRTLITPDGVVENDSRPLLFFIDENRLSQNAAERDAQLLKIRKSLACRGDRSYLARITDGTLIVTSVNLEDRKPGWKSYRSDAPDSLTFFSRLALGRSNDFPTGKYVDFLFEEMFQLVEKTATRLDQLNVNRSDIVSLIARALFFRFLVDRKIISHDQLNEVSEAQELTRCFDTARYAAATSQWLDRTFNGDFLPLSEGGGKSFFTSLDPRVYFHLGGVVQGMEPVGDEEFQLRLPITWGDLDFAHIPVGLLSQVYERLSWKWDRPNARETSVYYTPRNIAAALVAEVFNELPGASCVRVLDPACGAGIFLVTAFRRICQERWKKTGKRPNTIDIRKILRKQIVGFDISDSALKLTALSLYLTAIELDPDPIPPSKLKFEAMRAGENPILFDWRKKDDKCHGPVIGSLGSHPSEDSFKGKFDLILCNPPLDKHL